MQLKVELDGGGVRWQIICCQSGQNASPAEGSDRVLQTIFSCRDHAATIGRAADGGYATGLHRGIDAADELDDEVFDDADDADRGESVDEE